ncbi:hypothetical protein [Corynebacterium ammoniagenes]|uniref:EcsC family protein n=2 Tax=Corynebacterium ammoniagenes TaxID=1697 RepID=A0AAV5G9L6_CORAM|nr:hypothetical protein [Corynebacterium ammoniagenes]APT82946.1 membrane protein [Corynebacterium ammoniagenes DSM 20306]AQS73990.1 hypothetical protein CA40472_08755 [Corynebacterium ammoniagenes]EFG80617.1 hypothetical protein HMPREF0281_01981 [Corynebacterium ammoniagenes DSM 20306]GJN42795.1 hypothetical protein CAT723_12740 [Corynebacterium ammoniagenes]
MKLPQILNRKKSHEAHDEDEIFEGEIVDEPVSPEAQELLNNDDKFGSMIMSGLQKAVAVQSSTVAKYVDSVRKRNPDASAEEIQEILDKHFMRVVQGTGAGAGAASAIPGVGLVTGAAAIGAESLVFIEAAAWYFLASAHNQGVDLSTKERRMAVVLIILNGSQGSALVDTFVQDVGKGKGLPTASALTRFSTPSLTGLNGRLLNMFIKNMSKRVRWMWVSKLVPFGIGAALGAIANRKLGNQMVKHTHTQIPALVN